MTSAGDRFSVVEIGIGGYEDIILARQRARVEAQRLGFNIIDQTKIVTAVSELARNIVVHAGSGVMRIGLASPGPGLVFTFVDQGPGMADVPRALSKGYSTSNSLGLGLGGAKALGDRLDIQSQPGRGASITFTKYLPR